jgi:peptide/nickel transport system substrate-binding protein
MKRFFVLFLALVMVFTALGFVPGHKQISAAQEAPAGVFYGTWPYTLPPDHSLNSFVSTGGMNTNLGVIYRGLVELQPAFYMWATNEWVPILAESFGFTEDNTAYEMTLRSDAMWSNGSPVNADDVLITYALGKVIGWAQYSYISSVEKVDDHTVRFIFSGEPSLVAERLILKEWIVNRDAYADLGQRALDLIAAGAATDSPEWTALRDELNQFRPETVIASGPYTYSLEDVSDSYMTLHWQPNSIFSDQVNFGEIRIWAGETETTTPLVLSGDIAWSTNVYPPATQQSFQDAGIRLIIQPRMYGPALLFNHTVAPFDVKEVRQAMAYVIDREENAFLTNGFGATATEYMAGLLDSSVPAMMNQEDIDKLNRYEFSTEKAEELLTSIGYTRNDDGKWVDADGNTISAEYKFPAEFADFSGASQNAIDQLNEFGFDITGVAVPWQECAEDIRDGNFELSVWSWGAGSPFASRQFYGPIQRFNYVDPALSGEGRPGMNFPMEFEYNGEMINLNQMINEASSGLDFEVQKQRAGKIALILNDLMPFIPLNVILSTEPWNESLLAGAPEDGDPILQNPSADHFVLLLLLNGTLAPAQ